MEDKTDLIWMGQTGFALFLQSRTSLGLGFRFFMRVPKINLFTLYQQEPITLQNKNVTMKAFYTVSFTILSSMGVVSSAFADPTVCGGNVLVVFNAPTNLTPDVIEMINFSMNVGAISTACTAVDGNGSRNLRGTNDEPRLPASPPPMPSTSCNTCEVFQGKTYCQICESTYRRQRLPVPWREFIPPNTPPFTTAATDPLAVFDCPPGRFPAELTHEKAVGAIEALSADEGSYTLPLSLTDAKLKVYECQGNVVTK